MADEMKEPQSPEEKRLWLESTTDMDSETLKKNELKERTLTDPWNRSFTAPNYWTYEDIEQWKELMKENNLEIVSSLEVPYHAAKILSGEEELDSINNLEELTLPQRIESIGQLIDMEKQDRKYAWQFSRLSEKDRSEFISSNKSIDDFIDEKLNANGIKTVTIESEEEFNRWAEDLDGIDNNPEQVYKDLHGNLPEKGSYIDEGIEQIQADGGMSEVAMEAEISAEENPRPDFIDEQGNPHWFDEEEPEEPVDMSGYEFAEYIHSPEFIEKFGDWEKANRLEKLKNAESIIGNESITIEGVDVSDLVARLRQNYSPENLKQLQAIEKDIGTEVLEQLRKQQGLNFYDTPALINSDTGIIYKIQMQGIKEVGRHNLFQRGHLEAVRNIPELIEKAVFIGKEKNEDGRNPKLKEFHYYASEMKIDDEDFTAKIVFTLNDKGEFFYDQSLSNIEKGRLVDIIQEKNRLEVFNPKKSQDNSKPIEVLNPLISQKNSNAYYDKRLINICQVPQMPYLEKNPVTGKWQPTQEAVELVKNGKLYIEKTGQKYQMVRDMGDKKMENEKIIKASNIWSELRTANSVSEMSENDYERYKFAVMDYLFQRGIDDAAGFENSTERNVALFNQLDEKTRKVFEKYGDSRIDFDDSALAIKIAGTSNANIISAKRDFSEQVESRRYLRELEEQDRIIDEKEYQEWEEMLDDNQIAEEQIEKMQANGGMSEAAMEAEIVADEKAQGSEIEEESPKNEQNSSLEKSALEKAADLLKGMNFNSQNYKDLLSVINKISEMNGLENLEVPKEEQIQATQASDARQQTTSAEVSDIAADAPGNEIEPFDPKAPVVYGKTMLPAFAVLADGKLQSIENAVVKSHDKGKNTYIVDNGTEIFELPESTFKTLLQDKIEEEQKQSRLAEGKAIVFEDKARGVKGTVIPEWAMYTQNGLETFKDFVPTGFNQAENSYTLSNGNSTMTVTAERFKEITAPERFENHFDEDSPAWKKLCETQYNDFFKPRDNTAYNFRHNLSVYCRKEANSPCDALHLAKEIVQRMPKDEQKKTEKLLKTMAHENESTNELIARIYHESIKEMPLNEDYIKQHQPKNVIARPFYDTISESGKKVEDDPSLIKGTSDRNLKIGDTLKNVDVQMGKLFGGGKDSMHFDELKVVSASKEGNSITLMDSNKSYFKLPRDTVLEHYKEQQLKEMKHEQRHNRSNSMSLAYA